MRYARDFVSKRVLRGGNTTQSRFYAVETDDRRRLDASRSPAGDQTVGSYRFVRSLAASLSGEAGNGPLASSKFLVRLSWRTCRRRRASRSSSRARINRRKFTRLVHTTLIRRSGNNGTTVVFTQPLEVKPADQWADLDGAFGGSARRPGGHAADFQRQSGIEARRPELNLRGAIQMAKMRVRLGEHEDETSEVCQWLIPQAHPYEHWSDAPAYDGTVSIIQPLIAPLYGGKSAHEMLSAFTETPEKSSFESVRDYWRGQTLPGADYETWWNHSVHCRRVHQGFWLWPTGEARRRNWW